MKPFHKQKQEPTFVIKRRPAEEATEGVKTRIWRKSRPNTRLHGVSIYLKSLRDFNNTSVSAN